MSTYTLSREAYELLVEAFDGDERRAGLVAGAIELALRVFVEGEWSRGSRERRASRSK